MSIKICIKKTQTNIIMKKTQKRSQNLMKHHNIRKEKMPDRTAAHQRNQEEKRNPKRRDNQGPKATKNRENSVKRIDQNLQRVQKSRTVNIHKKTVHRVAVADQNLEVKVLANKVIVVSNKDSKTTNIIKERIFVVMRDEIEITMEAIGITRETGTRNTITREITDKIGKMIMEEGMTEKTTTGTITEAKNLAIKGGTTGAAIETTTKTTITGAIKTVVTEIQETT